MTVEDFLFSACGGFLFGAVAGYAAKKVMKIVVVVVGLFVAGLAFLSYKGWIDQVDSNGEFHYVNIAKCNNPSNAHP